MLNIRLQLSHLQLPTTSATATATAITFNILNRILNSRSTYQHHRMVLHLGLVTQSYILCINLFGPEATETVIQRNSHTEFYSLCYLILGLC